MKTNQNFKKITLLTFGFFALLLIYSCVNEFENSSDNNTVAQSIDDVQLVNGVLKINNKSSIQNIVDDYKKGNEEQFNRKIVSLQKNGFKPLTPIFEENNTKMVEDFIQRKKERIQKRNLDYGLDYLKVNGDEDIDLDDELIFDPVLSTLLNEGREIIIDNKFYKYTEMGLYFCDVEDVVILKNHLNNMTPQERIEVISTYKVLYDSGPCDPIDPQNFGDFSLFQNVMPCGGGGGGSGTGNTSGTPISNTYAPVSDLIKQGLPICYAEANSLWEMVFGTSEGCIQSINGDKRVKTKFWNQNYYIFSSMGCKVKFQKHIETWIASWWEKSYADKLELGVNYVSYEYNFNVPAFNQAQYNYQTTFFEYNGTKYNVNGQIINTVPVGNGTFVFDTSSSQSVMNITILGYHLTNANFNQAIDLAVKQLVDAMPSSSAAVKSEIISKLQNGTLKFNVVNAVPFDTKVKFFTSDVKWTSNGSHSIEHYFDLNFLLTWKNTYSGIGDYLSGLNGATDYKNVTADIYGVAINSGEIKGSRIIFNYN